jgi:hypothetical protein
MRQSNAGLDSGAYGAPLGRPSTTPSLTERGAAQDDTMVTPSLKERGAAQDDK